MLVPCVIGKNTYPLHVWGPQEGTQRLLPVCCCLCSFWKGDVPEPALYWTYLQLVTMLVGQAADKWGDLGQRSVSRTLRMVISLSPGKATSGRACLLPWLAGGTQDNLFLYCLGRKDSLCQWWIYLGSLVLVRHFGLSFDLIYLLILELYYVQDTVALFSYFFSILLVGRNF